MPIVSFAESQRPAPLRPDRPGIRLSFPTVDDCLGPGGQRFFGSGYRRVRYEVRDAVFDQGWLRSRAGVAHPVDWSSKNSSTPSRPHLTTVDGLLLAVRAAEFCTGHENALHHRERRQSWPRRVDIKAGGAPVEDGLADFSLEARLDDTQPLRDASRVSCRVAAMRARVEVVHAAPAVPRTPRQGRVDDDLLDARYPGTYGRDYQDHRQEIRHLVVDLGTGRATAMVGLGVAPVVPWPDEPEPTSGRPVSMLDAFVVTMQLGQALLYESDGIDRHDTDTLWMRRATITSSPPSPTPTEPIPASAALLDRELVQIRGESWRTAVIEGSLGGIHTRCAVAHRLPSAVAC